MNRRGISVLVLSWLIGVTAAYGAPLADDDVVGAWLFDDASDLGSDSSASGNHGDVVGNVKSANDGAFGGAALFEGNESWISVEDHESLHFTQGTDFTAAAWLRTDMVAGDPPMIVAKNYQPAQVQSWWALYYANQAKSLDGSASFFLRDSAGTSHHIAGGPKVSDGAWHHIAGTREGDTLRFYVDGAEVATKGDADFDVGTAPAPLHMMSHLNRWLVGSLDEVLLVRRALTGTEIEGLISSGVEGFLAVEPAGKLATQWGHLKR